MGGNAIKNCSVRRYRAAEYFPLEEKVLAQLRSDFPGRKIDALKAYKNKTDFGDMDILLESDGLLEEEVLVQLRSESTWLHLAALNGREVMVDFEGNTFISESGCLAEDLSNYVQKTFASKEVMPNGPVLSFEHGEFQIDLILTPRHEFSTSAAYYSWNDLGNLCGCLTRTMGLKLGHDGLSYAFSEGTRRFDLSVVSTDWKDILSVIDLDYERWLEGFDSLQDIFRFVVSSRYFNRDIYLLHNRNSHSRVRDIKRQTYSKFLAWLDEQPAGSIPEHPLANNKQDWLPHLFRAIPGFESHYQKTALKIKEAATVKRKFNGGLVRFVTGLDEAKLGELMLGLKAAFGGADALSQWVLKSSPAKIEQTVLYFQQLGVLPAEVLAGRPR